MARRQLVRGNIDLGLLAEAGRPQNLVGEGIAGIGAVLGEALKNAQKNSDDLDAADEKQAAENLRENAKKAFGKQDEGVESKILADTQNPLDQIIEEQQKVLESVTGTKIKDNEVYGYAKVGADAKAKFLKENPNATAEQAQEVYDNMVAESKASNLEKYGTINPTAKGKTNNIVQSQYDEQGKYIALTSKGKPFIETSTTQGSSSFQRKKSPLERRRQSPRGFNNFNNIVNAAPRVPARDAVSNSAFDKGQVSGYTPGKTYVQKMRKLSAPEWMGVGAAAVEGYNLSVDRINYEKQVSADLQDYYEDSFKGLQAPETGIDFLDASMKEVALGARNDWIAHEKQRDKWFSEGRGAEWTAKRGDLEKLPIQLKQVSEAFPAYKKQLQEGLEGDEYDLGASEGAAKDMAATILKGGSPLGLMKTENGNIVVGGATRSGMPVVQGIANFLNAPFKLVAKKNAFNYVQETVEQFKKSNKGELTRTAIGPDGISRTVALDFDKEIAPALMSMFEAELDSEMDVRGYASRNNWGDDGLDSANFNAAVKNNKDPKEFVKQKFLEVARQQLAPTLGISEEKSTGLATARFNEQANIREENRKQDKTDEYNAVLNNLVKVEENVRFEGGDIIIDSETGQPTIVNSKETLYTAFPNIKQLEGKGIKEIIVKDGKVTVYPQSKTTTRQNADGTTSTSTSAEDAYVFLLSDGIETVQQNIINVAEEVDYKGPMAAYAKNRIN